MSVENSPEFKKALQEACEAQYRSFLYGGMPSKDKIGGTIEELQVIATENEARSIRNDELARKAKPLKTLLAEAKLIP